METNLWFWIGFNAFLVAMLALDLGVFHRKAHAVSVREAATWSVVWVGIALAFNLGIWLYAGSEPALQFLTGYLIEKSLAVDNIFVFVMIFLAFGVPAAYQHRVLFIGVVSALIMRGAFIAVGAYLISQFSWIILVFGAFLVFTGIRMFTAGEKSIDPKNNGVVRFVQRFIPVLPEYRGTKFIVKENGIWMATPLLLVLALVEFSDLIFAIDSIPAIFAITNDPFIVYTSNALAILGLRSLYFLLAGVIHRFRYLKAGLATVLVFVGLKMLAHEVYKVPTFASLGVVIAILAISIIASLIASRSEGATEATHEASKADT